MDYFNVVVDADMFGQLPGSLAQEDLRNDRGRIDIY